MKILHPSQTRWLSLEAVVKRVLECFAALKLYFSSLDIDPKKDISDILEKTSTKANLKFLKFILSYVNKLNRIFQSEESLVQYVGEIDKNSFRFFCYS